MSGELLKATGELQAESAGAFSTDKEMVTETVCPSRLAEVREGVSYGTVEHITYRSAVCGCDRGANILFPAGYSTEKSYPVLYFLHGIFGDEFSMLQDENSHLKEVFGNLTAEGLIDDCIVVFPNMYATGNPELKPGFSAEQTAPYDNFINDLTEDLIPYVEGHYPVLKDRMHRGIIGFSMGGRETLYIGTVRSDLFAYIGAVAPAPGLTPGRDWAMEHPGTMAEEELVIRKKEFQPELLMVLCGTKDGVVGKFPESYHRILTANSVKHLWYEVPEADHDSNAIKSGLYNLLIRWVADIRG